MIASRRNIGFAGFSVLLFLFMAGPIRSVFTFAMDLDNKHASQIVLIPFITAFLIYLDKQKIFSQVRYASLGGAATFVAGLALYVVGKVAGGGLVEGDQLAMLIASLVVMWLGGFLFFYGPAAFRAGLFPLLFLVFFIPIPSFVLSRTISVLQRGSAETAYFLLKSSGTPIYRQGYFFSFASLTIEVAPECSGIRSGISIVITSLLAGYLMLRTVWRRGVLLAVALPILIFKNALRITMLSLLAIKIDTRILTSELHREGGIPFFVLGLVMLYPVLALLVRSEKKQAKFAGIPATVPAMPLQPKGAAD
jgi:exosortase